MICTKCGIDKDPLQFYATGKVCRKCVAIRQRARKETRAVSGLCKWCGRVKPALGKLLCTPCQSKRREYSKKIPHEKLRMYATKARERIRLEVFDAYGGPVCACCGENHIEFLSIDHIGGDGAEHRRAVKVSGGSMYPWLRKRGYPAGFRVLCMNCNSSLGWRGYCPHDKLGMTQKVHVGKKRKYE